MALPLDELTTYLDGFLRCAEVRDSPNALNGLQVTNDGHVGRLAVAVDACQATIDGAAEHGADLLLVHHGLFWGGLEPVTGRQGRRLRTLVRRGIALYAAHLPLDVHPEVGNNAVLARRLGVSQPEWFCEYEGQPIGVMGSLNIARDALAHQVTTLLGTTPKLIATGPDTVRRIGIVTGGGGDFIKQVVDAGVDTYLTGEGQHHTYFDAEEFGVNVLYAGHYATETVGVKALAEHLASRFGLPWDFIDHPTGL